MITVVEVIHAVGLQQHTRHGRHIDLDLSKAIRIEILVLQQKIDMLQDTLTVETSELVKNWARADRTDAHISITVGQLEVIRLKVLANLEAVIVKRVGLEILADEGDENGKGRKAGHSGVYA